MAEKVLKCTYCHVNFENNEQAIMLVLPDRKTTVLLHIKCAESHDLSGYQAMPTEEAGQVLIEELRKAGHIVNVVPQKD